MTDQNASYTSSNSPYYDSKVKTQLINSMPQWEQQCQPNPHKKLLLGQPPKKKS